MENDIEQPLLQACNTEENNLIEDTTCNESNQHQSRSFYEQLSFNWINPLLQNGFTLPQLQQHHLPPLPTQVSSDACGSALWEAWEHEIDAARINGGRSPSLLRALFKPFGWPFLALGGLKFVNDALNFAGPVLLNGLLRYLDASSSSGAVFTLSLPPRPSTPATTSSLSSFIMFSTFHFPDPASDTYGALCAGLLAITFFLKAFLNAQFSYWQGIISCQVRAALTSLCFRQSLSVSTSQVSTVGTGRIQTLMSVDAEKVLGLFIGFHELWSLPFQIGVALYLLYLQVRFAFLAGLILVVLIIPLNKLLANGIQRASVSMMAAKDQRIALLGELLKGIRVIKASGWETAFSQRVDAARKKELHSLAIRKYLDAVCVYLWAATSLLFSIGTFGLFVLLGERLTAQTVFTSLALFSVLLGPINSFPWVINGIVEAFVSLKRLSLFLTVQSPKKKNTLLLPPPPLPLQPPSPSRPLLDTNGSTSSSTNPSNLKYDIAIEITNANFYWAPPPPATSTSRNDNSNGNGGEIFSPTLQDINLSIPKGSFVVVTGHVGSGKSSLFNAILGEMYTTSSATTTQDGAVLPPSVQVNGKTAYTAQDAWLMPGTIKDNIMLSNKSTTFSTTTSTQEEEEADQQLQTYLKILNACALSSDELSSLSHGDGTHVGDAGSTLSGGQRARIALARALYSNADIYLFDDVLAAVDANVASWLIDHVLLGGSFLSGKTVVVATHSAVLMKAADMVVTMAQGKIQSIEQNSKNRSGGRRWRSGNQKIFPNSDDLSFLKGSSSSRTGTGTSGTSSSNKNRKNGLESTTTGDIYTRDSLESAEDEELRTIGHVKWTIYQFYIKMQGVWAPITILSLALMQATRNGSDVWLSYWVTNAKNTSQLATTLSNSSGRSFFSLNYFEIDLLKPLDPEVKFYLGILLYIAAANSIFTLIRAFSFAQGGLVAAQRLHQKLVSSILSLPATFFDLNPSGRILNRFSSDTAIADDNLPFISNIFLAQLFGLLGVTIVLCFTQPYLVVALGPLILAYRVLQRYYRASSRKIRRLESIAKSPVYTTFSAALRGGATIRAFTGVSEKFISSAHKSIDTQQRASLAALAASTWLGLRLQIVAGVIAALVGGLAVVQHVGLLPGAAQATSAGFVGLSLAYALPITGLLNGLLTCGAETEQEMVSVERIAEYINKSESLSQQQCLTTTTLENDSISSSSSSADTNATRGASIVFENVWMKYTTSSPFVLFNFNVVLQPGTHAGLCGRTGAGKSSAVSCLLRLAEINSGRILVDGVDIRALPLCTLRSAIGFIPQSPFIFSGTVAENVDPVGKYSSDAIVDALQQVGLWPVLKQALGNTTTDHRNGGGGGSNGGGGGASNDAASEENQDDDENAFLMLLPKEEEETEEARKVLNLKLGNEGGIGLSQGQQQMLCLARVVVQRQNLKVVCLDEASAAVDPATAESMQRVIKACFKGCTIIEVAHRLRSVSECDFIYVVDKGQVAESGRPKELAEDSRSLFAGMLREQADKGGCILM